MKEVFPLLEGLCADKEKDVKISCIKQIPHISMVVDNEIRIGTLENLFLKLL